jgi:hypothetical protein
MYVSEHMGWVRKVVQMNVYFRLGNPGGSGFRVGKGPDGKMGKCRGQFTSNLRERWMDPITARRVPSKWEKEQGEQGEHCVYSLSTLCTVYIGTNAVMNDTSCI